MAVRYLVPGERAVCKACGAKTVVPEDARLVEYVPPASRPVENEPTSDAAPSPDHCPACGRPGAPIPRCVACGYEPAAVRLYNPKYFEHFAVIFSGLVPIWMASSNFRRLGLKTRARRILNVGIPLYLVIFAGLLVIVPEKQSTTASHLLKLGLALLVNYPVGWFLKREQLGIYEESLRSGGWTAPAWKGILGAIGIGTALYFAASFVASPYLDRHYNHGRKLMEQGKYEAAALAFERALNHDSTDAEVLLKIAECDARLGQIPASMSHLRQFLRHHPRDARGWAILGVLYEAQGDSVASDSCYRAAGNLNPEVLKAVGLDRGGR
jgi:hypothetical protein